MLKTRDHSKFKESNILTELMTNLSIVEFYFTKIESYLRRKHDSVVQVDESKALESDMSDTEKLEESEEIIHERSNSGESLIKKDDEKPNSETEESDLDHDLEFYDTLRQGVDHQSI